jgi:DNA repair exonuclease SbcCD ATPase subunit
MSDIKSMNCPSCNDLICKETFLGHIKKCTPEYFIQEIFNLPPESEWAERIKYNEMEVNGKFGIGDAIKILQGDPVFWYADDKAYLDLHTGRVYAKESTALSHILEHPKAHSDALFKLIQESLTKEKLLFLLKYIRARTPRVVVDDEKVSRAEKAVEKVKKECEEKIVLANVWKDKWFEHQKTDDAERIRELDHKISEKNTYIYEVESKCRKLDQELRCYKEKEQAEIGERQNNLGKDMEELTFLDKMQIKYNKMKEKLEGEVEKKVKKLKEEHDKKLEALEKREKKYNKTIKTLKHQVETLQHQAELKDMGSSESDSD